MNNDNTLESSSAINTHALKKFKIVFLGDQGVGKTSIIKRFIFDNFDENNSATIGVDLISKNITVENKTVRLNLWDTAGQERFRCLIPGYIRDSNVAIIVYDITRKDTFASLQNWVNDVRSQREDDVVLSLIGCKADLEARREVTYEEGQKFAENNNASFCEVSAKTGNNIAQSFQNVVNRLMGAIVTAPIQIPASTEGRESRIQLGQNIDHSAINDGTRENLTVIKDKKSGGCC